MCYERIKISHKTYSKPQQPEKLRKTKIKTKKNGKQYKINIVDNNITNHLKVNQLHVTMELYIINQGTRPNSILSTDSHSIYEDIQSKCKDKGIVY